DPILEELRFSVNNYKYMIEYNDESLITKKQKSNIENELPREWIIAERRAQINMEIDYKVKITTIRMPLFDKIGQDENNDPEIDSDNENSNISNPEITSKVISSISKGAQRNDRNVGKKVKHVIITFAVLDDINNIHNPDYHYMVVLYPGSENYKSLDIVTTFFRSKLCELTKEGLIINNIHWYFNLYFSSDWKFLAISLGFNAANNQLWVLVLYKIKENRFFNDITQEIIIEEMDKIGVGFEF
ncbi:25510_t:CDS:2, partial [Gigaspora margarita]